MAERPLLAMPRPERRASPAGRPRQETIHSADARRQASRLGPKFERLERSPGDPDALGELRNDPSAIVPERALVFEVASEVADFYRAVRGVPGLEFLGEDEGDDAPNEDFYLQDRHGNPKRRQTGFSQILLYDPGPEGARGSAEPLATVPTRRKPRSRSDCLGRRIQPSGGCTAVGTSRPADCLSGRGLEGTAEIRD